MFLNSVVLEFLKFVAFFIVMKALFQLINVEARRHDLSVVAGVSGLVA